MGRKTTKGGRILNPTDAYRKALRKKELKRNKLQRKKVREAILSKKDPEELRKQLGEIERLEREAGDSKKYKVKKKQIRDSLDKVIKRQEKEKSTKQPSEEPKAPPISNPKISPRHPNPPPSHLRPPPPNFLPPNAYFPNLQHFPPPPPMPMYQTGEPQENQETPSNLPAPPLGPPPGISKDLSGGISPSPPDSIQISPPLPPGPPPTSSVPTQRIPHHVLVSPMPPPWPPKERFYPHQSGPVGYYPNSAPRVDFAYPNPVGEDTTFRAPPELYENDSKKENSGVEVTSLVPTALKIHRIKPISNPKPKRTVAPNVAAHQPARYESNEASYLKFMEDMKELGAVQ